MNYKNFFYILIFLIINNCSVDNLQKKDIDYEFKKKFSNKGFAIIYNDQLFKDKVISKKLDQRSLLIFQKNLKKDTTVKIINILNDKTLIAKVANNSQYPSFNNSVISNRIATLLEIDPNEPYIEITSIPKNSMFIAKTSKTFDEEKKVASKAPVEEISINDINKKTNKSTKIKINKKFSYTIKIADFYFKETALLMKKRIKKESKIKNPKIKRIADNKYRVYLGPYTNINALQNSFNDIKILKFENIEIIKND